jgi:hypothetical protein
MRTIKDIAVEMVATKDDLRLLGEANIANATVDQRVDLEVRYMQAKRKLVLLQREQDRWINNESND